MQRSFAVHRRCGQGVEAQHRFAECVVGGGVTTAVSKHSRTFSQYFHPWLRDALENLMVRIWRERPAGAHNPLEGIIPGSMRFWAVAQTSSFA